MRADEEYFAKYFQYRVPRKQKKLGGGDFEDEEAEMDAYADKIFEQQLQENDEDFDDDDDLLDDDGIFLNERYNFINYEKNRF